MPAVKYMHLRIFFKSVCIITAVLTGNLFFTIHKPDSNVEAIRLSQQKAIDFLINIQRKDGAICDTINPLFETWETILAITAIYRSNSDTNDLTVRKGLSFLMNNENKEGLVCHNQKCKQAYCLETTAVYYNLLKLTGKKGNLNERLKQIAVIQKQSGEWEIGNPDVRIEKDFPSVTAFVLNLFNDEAVEPVYKKQALNWLLKKQTRQGDWGSAWEYYGCKGYALWPILKVLHKENTTNSRMARNKAVSFILSKQNSNGSWFDKDPALEKQTSAALQTALMLKALQHAGVTNTEAVSKGINFLVNSQQKNGNWTGGYFPIPEKRYTKEEYVFATALAIEVMQTYLLNNSN